MTKEMWQLMVEMMDKIMIDGFGDDG